MVNSFGVFVAKFEHISPFVLLFLLLTLNKQMVSWAIYPLTALTHFVSMFLFILILL